VSLQTLLQYANHSEHSRTPLSVFHSEGVDYGWSLPRIVDYVKHIILLQMSQVIFRSSSTFYLSLCTNSRDERYTNAFIVTSCLSIVDATINRFSNDCKFTRFFSYSHVTLLTHKQKVYKRKCNNK
jgi:hypothetical protein